MILIESESANVDALDATIVVASSLAARSFPVLIDAEVLPANMDRQRRLDLVGLVGPVDSEEFTDVLILGAELAGPKLFERLRRISLPATTRVAAIGRFADRQSRVAVQSGIAFALEREPQIVDLSDMQPKPFTGIGTLPLLSGPSQAPVTSRKRPVVLLWFSEEFLHDTASLDAVEALGQSREMLLLAVAAPETRAGLWSSRYSNISMIELGDLPPHAIAALADIAVVTGDVVLPGRMSQVALDMLWDGKPVIDSTGRAHLAQTGAPVLRGPHSIGALGAYLSASVLPNRATIADRVRRSPWLSTTSLDRIVRRLGLVPGDPPPAHRPTAVFCPTNGHGLGHAQRSSAVAGELELPVGFAAFPSCVPLLQRRGFDCLPLVSRSKSLSVPDAHDLVNFGRLRTATGHGDVLVFDGSFIFDSIYRTVLERRLRAVWIRRGLWRPGQARKPNFAREHIFRSVIVPGEAFAELNDPLSFGSHVYDVGPIVAEAEDGLDRNQIRQTLGTDFDELVVTMLGGGVASDRLAQTQALCHIAEKRAACLHLVVTWPGARVAPQLFQWSRTRVVRTLRASALCRLADLVVSAAGYNSFHEIIYGRRPAIFLPQTAEFLDDQDRRARAAAERGLAIAVGPDDLVLLEREVLAVLDKGKGETLLRELGKADLPKLGTRAAAEIIAGEFAR